MFLASITSMRNQEKNIYRIISGYLASSRKPDVCVFVLDRCTDSTGDLIASLAEGRLNYKLLTAPWCDDMFAAGRPRDFAIDYVRSTYPQTDCFVFLDGDCIPSIDLFQEHERAHETIHPYPCLVNGIRLDETQDFKTLPDKRSERLFVPGKNTVTISPYNLYTDASTMIPGCWGCNMSLNSTAVDIARVVNTALFNQQSRTFAPCFDGRWGGEDPFIAAVLFRMSTVIANLDPVKSHITHIYHDGSHRTADHARVLQNALKKFKSSIINKSLVCEHDTVDTKYTPTALSLTAYSCVLRHITKAAYYDSTLLALSRVLCVTERDNVDVLVNLRKVSDETTAVKDYVFELSWFGNLRNHKYRMPEHVQDTSWCYMVACMNNLALC